MAPILTIFIGGNHEASNYLQELAYGGWVAPNIYYLGYAGVIVVNGVRIAGISGIFRDYNFEKGHFEYPPYDFGATRSVYGIRSLEVFRLSQLTNKIDIMLSHDWPDQIWEYGNKEQLLRFKPYFREDMENGKMGSGPCFDLLTTLRPHNWYAAHMHCRFDAKVPHDNNEFTRFVALDKCLPNRKFLDSLTIGDEETESTDVKTLPEIEYDLEWLTVLHLTNNLLNVSRYYTKLPLQPGPDDPQDNIQRYEFTPTKEEMDAVLKKFKSDLRIPKNFVQTIPAYDPQRDGRNFKHLNERIQVELNPQTTEFCAKLGIDDPLFLAAKFDKINLTTSSVNLSKSLDEGGSSKECAQVPTTPRAPLASLLPQPKFVNDEEIDLDELDDEETPPKAEELEEENKADESLDQQDQPEDLSMKTEIPAPTSIEQHVPLKSPDEVECGSPPRKNFKRRNQEIYTANDDE